MKKQPHVTLLTMIQGILGIVCLLYYVYLSMRYGFFYIVFSWTFLVMGIFLIAYSGFTLYKKRSLLSYFPRFLQYGMKTLISVCLAFFLFVEGNIIYTGMRASSTQADTLIVLGAQLNGDNISRLLRYRLETAVSFAEQYPDSTILVSGGQGAGENRSEASAMRAYLIEHGVNSERILMEDTSLDTYQNLQNSKELLTSNEVSLVTNSFHMYRAKQLCEELDMTCHVVPAKTDLDLAANFYFREFFAVVKDWVVR